MNYTSTLLLVSDMERSHWFYQTVLGLSVVADFGANVTFDGSVVLRFIQQGMSAEEVAVRMDVPLDFVVSCLQD